MADFDKIPNVLVTGGSGFFGRAFCRFLLQHNLAERVAVLSRGEHAQASMREELWNDARLRFLIGDVRDQSRLAWAMQGIDLVIHAAALKRIEVNRYNPEEAVRTNVIGALNVVAAARQAGVKKVIGLSSDKAFLPISCYGQSKALMESVMLASNETGGAAGPRFSCVRYGNIWKSAGSVVPKWLAMIGAGATSVPVSDLQATRFFMLIDEAVELVFATASHMRGGEIAIPDLPAYRVGDLVEALGVKAEIIGLPKFEKLHESMDESRSSDRARRLSVEFLRRALEQTK